MLRRPRDRGAQRGAQPQRRPSPPCERVQRHPSATTRLPWHAAPADDCLRVQAEHAIRDVRRVALGSEHPVRALRTRERAHVAAQRRPRCVDERVVARQPIRRCCGEQLLAHLPGGVGDGTACEGRAHDRLGDVAEPVLGQHLRAVEALRERELLVRVADAVAPRQHQVLDQRCALRVHHARLRHRDRRALGEPRLPVADDRCARLLVLGERRSVADAVSAAAPRARGGWPQRHRCERCRRSHGHTPLSFHPAGEPQRPPGGNASRARRRTRSRRSAGNPRPAEPHRRAAGTSRSAHRPRR